MDLPLLADIAIGDFKRRLLSLGVRPGAFLTLREISSLLGIPLGKTREVTMRLEQEGFVQIHPQRGIQVRSITVQTIYDAFRFRAIMEEASVARFASECPKAQIEAMIAKTEALHKLEDETVDLNEQVAAVDWEMHFSIIEQEANAFLTDAYRLNATYIRWIRANAKIPPARHREVIGEHLEILNACLERAPDKAVAALRLHIEHSLKQTLKG